MECEVVNWIQLTENTKAGAPKHRKKIRVLADKR
jgi:hypothetical protein